MANPKIVVMQARQWRNEVAEMAKRGKPFSDEQLDAIARILANTPAALEMEGINAHGKTFAELVAAWREYLIPVFQRGDQSDIPF